MRVAALVAAAVPIVCVATLALTGASLPLLHSTDHHHYLGTDGWPATGQGAYRIGDGDAHVSADQQPVPIASVAKVMTALLVVKEHPLSGSGVGPALTVSSDDVADTERRRANDESIVEVATGETLTERAALEALLLPSANNVAWILARWSAGSVDEFVADMNSEAARLDMDSTHYTDPSGYDTATTSTAADQLKLAEVAADVPVLRDIMAMASARLPVAGTVHNTDSLLGHDGFVGMKTGSTDAAGGCFMFRAQRVVDGRRVELVGVVLGQPGQHDRPLYEAGLNAARQLADQVAPANPSR